MARRHSRGAVEGGKQLFRVNTVEFVAVAAEFAVHADRALFFEYRVYFVAPEHAQHGLDPRARAGTAEADRHAREQAYILFVIQAVDDLTHRQCEQLFPRDGRAEVHGAYPGAMVDRFGLRQALHKPAPIRSRSGGEPQACGELFGTGEIVFERLGHGQPLQGDNRLVTFLAFQRVDRDREATIAHQRGERRIRDFPLPLRNGAHGPVAGAFDHQQADRPLALYLHDEPAVEFERGGEQRRGRHQFAQHLAHAWRVLAPFEHRLPGRVEMHDLATDRRVLEDETLQ